MVLSDSSSSYSGVPTLCGHLLATGFHLADLIFFITEFGDVGPWVDGFWPFLLFFMHYQPMVDVFFSHSYTSLKSYLD